MTMTRHRGITLPTAAAGVLVAVLSGCGGGGEGETGSEPENQAAEQNSPNTSESEESPEATDGSDLDQCSDAECEVEVQEGDEIPLGGTQGIEEMVVDSANEEQVALTGNGPGTMVNGSVGAPFPDEPVLFLNGIAITVVSADADHAVIALSPQQEALPTTSPQPLVPPSPHQ